MEHQSPVGYRPPLTSLLPAAGVLVLMALVSSAEGGWALAIVVVTLLAILRMRQLLIVAQDNISVTVFRTRHIPWSVVQGFEAGSTVRGGTVIRTTEGEVHSVAPCSWWGGPATAADIETLENILAAKRR